MCTEITFRLVIRIFQAFGSAFLLEDIVFFFFWEIILRGDCDTDAGHLIRNYNEIFLIVEFDKNWLFLLIGWAIKKCLFMGYEKQFSIEQNFFSLRLKIIKVAALNKKCAFVFYVLCYFFLCVIFINPFSMIYSSILQ